MKFNNWFNKYEDELHDAYSDYVNDCHECMVVPNRDWHRFLADEYQSFKISELENM